MAFCIRANLIGTRGVWSVYQFDSDGRQGRFEWNSETNELAVIEKMPGDDNNTHVSRAARAVFLAFRREGAIPKQASWNA